MIPVFLQDYLVEETKRLFGGFTLKNINGVVVPLNIYPQFLPARKGKKDADQYPFLVVQLIDGEDPNELDPNQCRVLFYCGVCDDDVNYQGYHDCLNVMQRLYEHLMSKRIFDHKYTVEYPIKWSVTEEDFYPYYYGGLETNWTVGKISREDDEFV
jgi:hypothetical protein